MVLWLTTHLPWHVCTHGHRQIDRQTDRQTGIQTDVVKCDRSDVCSKHTYALAVTSYKVYEYTLMSNNDYSKSSPPSPPKSPRSDHECFQDNNRILMLTDICSMYLIYFTTCPFYGERKPLSLLVTLVAQERLTHCPHFSCWLVACTWPSWGHRCPVFLELLWDVTCPVAQEQARGHSSSALILSGKCLTPTLWAWPPLSHCCLLLFLWSLTSTDCAQSPVQVPCCLPLSLSQFPFATLNIQQAAHLLVLLHLSSVFCPRTASSEPTGVFGCIDCWCIRTAWRLVPPYL